eukprot:gene7545-8382_t
MNLSCAYLGYTDNEERSTQLLAIAVILFALALPTAVANGLVVLAIFKKNELKSPTYFIIGNLALTDFLSGCSAFICYAIVSLEFSLGRDGCHVALFGTPWSYFLGFAAYNSILVQTVERYLAVFYPFWYHNHFTIRFSMLGCLGTWLLSASLVTLLLATKDNKLFFGFLGPLSLVGLIVNFIGYLQVFKEVKKVEKDMIKQQVLTPEERRKARRNSKIAKATAIILVCFSVSYTPLLIIEFYIAFMSGSKATRFVSDALYWAWMLCLVNSTLNPIIACRQLKVLRTAVFSLLRSLRRGGHVDPMDRREGFTSTRVSMF